MRLLASLLSAILLTSGVVAAQELRIGLGSEPTTLDPQFYNLTPNSEAGAYVFDTLVWSDTEGHLIPWLAQSWHLENDRTWDFTLRAGATFHDGSKLTTADVLASFARIPNVQNSPSNYAKFLSHITSAEAISPTVLRLVTDAPYPGLISDLTQIAIIPQRLQTAGTADFNAGRAMIGTGPYRFVEWVKGDRLVYARNDAFWGARPAWESVVAKPIGNSAARTAALLSGTVDLINQVPTDDMPLLQARPDLRITQIAEQRLIYLALDSVREHSPFVTDRDGKPLPANPLRDLRVRQAISHAIDRTALVDKVMSAQAVPAGDIMPPGTFGTAPDNHPDTYDLPAARRLMAEAGWPQGFGLTLHGPNDRYLNDAKVVQAAAQFLTRLGIAVKVETMPKSLYFGRVANQEFSAFLVGTSPTLGTGTLGMGGYMFMTRNPQKLQGAGNWTYYSNPRVDDLITRALVTVDDTVREALARQMTAIVLRDLPVVPLYFGFNTWAMRKDVDYPARVDSYTLALEVRSNRTPLPAPR